MARRTVVITDHGFAAVDEQRSILDAAGFNLVVAQCETAAEVVDAAKHADALLVQWAPITADVIAALSRAKIIVRYGIGVDNVDLESARAAGIPVCNVPDYCLDEVADHTLALALALGRQLLQMDARTRRGVWKMIPDSPMPAFREMLFGTAGFGRIARLVLGRARAFGFEVGAHDPYVEEDVLRRAGIRPLTHDELIEQSDFLSLHLPLTDETRRFISEERLARMKPTSILINTSRGSLIDTRALARALKDGRPAAAGLDVFEEEPLSTDHPIVTCPNALLTSHVAWYSEQSVPRLQRMAAEEVVRGLRGEPLRNQANR